MEEATEVPTAQVKKKRGGQPGNKSKSGSFKMDSSAVKEALEESFKGKTITITREWGGRYPNGKRRPGGRIPVPERADMMATIIENPDIKSVEFGRKYGYAIQEDQRKSSGAVQIIDLLKEELSGFKVPETEEILRADLLIVAHGLKDLHRRLREDPESLSVMELSLAVDKSFKRSRLLQGKSTSNVAIHLEDVKTMKESDLDAFLSDTIRIVEASGAKKE